MNFFLGEDLPFSDHKWNIKVKNLDTCTYPIPTIHFSLALSLHYELAL